MNLLANCVARMILSKRNVNPYMNAIRGVTKCAEDKCKCPKGRILNSPCKDAAHMMPPRKPPPKDVFKSMWESKPCDVKKAICPGTRFDDLYYKISDKAKRKYQQTWVACPPRLIKPKLVCEYPKDKYPPLERRRGKKPDTAKCITPPDLFDCNKAKNLKQNTKCLKVTLPGCRGIRASVKCKVVRKAKDCIPRKPPYPSFSECTKPKPIPKRPNECACLKIRSMCEVWTILRQKTVL